jgi:hypothetical protein
MKHKKIKQGEQTNENLEKTKKKSKEKKNQRKKNDLLPSLQGTSRVVAERRASEETRAACVF